MGLKKCHEFIDLYSFDPSTAIEFGLPVDRCKGMILLFPLRENDKEEERNPTAIGPKFIKQSIDNSCCMMALLHLLLNNPKELLDQSTQPEIIQKLLENETNLEQLIENSNELKCIHKEMALIGGTNVPEISENVLFHFVAFIPGGEGRTTNSVWLMDGRRSGPIEFKIEEEGLNNSFFEVACKIAKEEFVMKSTDRTNFAAIILILTNKKNKILRFYELISCY